MLANLIWCQNPYVCGNDETTKDTEAGDDDDDVEEYAKILLAALSYQELGSSFQVNNKSELNSVGLVLCSLIFVMRQIYFLSFHHSFYNLKLLFLSLSTTFCQPG
jgi:hypothetical protein